MTTRWKLRQDFLIARRSDGLVVLAEGGAYRLLHAGYMRSLTSTNLASAVDEADRDVAPANWRWDGTRWLSEGWLVLQEGTRWLVHSDRTGALGLAPHTHAYLAIQWCDLRRDRVGKPLRGPLAKNK